MSSMSRTIVMLSVAALGVAAVRSPSAQPRYRLVIGDDLPNLVLPQAQGGSLALRSLRGRPLAVSFYSRYCAPCQRELPALHRAVERANHGLPPSRQVLPIVISIDSPADTQAAQAHFTPSLRWLLDFDGRARTRFDPRTYPCTFLADAAGRVRFINRGFGPGYEIRVERWLRGLVVRGSSESPQALPAH